jgi:hypothetical protein
MTAQTTTTGKNRIHASNRETNMDGTDSLEPGATWV